MRRNKPFYKPPVCQCCGQTEAYLLALDKGAIKILLELLKGISAKGINEIHPTKELDLSHDKQWFATNLSRPRFHGLIAYVKDKKGYYCLTRKAGKFLKGEPVPQYAIISKVTGHQEGYWGEDEHQITLREIMSSDDIPMWDGNERSMIDYLAPIENSQASLFENKLQPTIFNVSIYA